MGRSAPEAGEPLITAGCQVTAVPLAFAETNTKTKPAVHLCAAVSFPGGAVYLEMETEIVITAVVYGGREPGYWRGR